MPDGPTVIDPTLEPGNAPPGPEVIRPQLERILASPQFTNAPSIAKMLRFVVERVLDGSADRIKEYTLGVDVFDRGSDFDPRQDTIVRVQGRRLRDRLDDYYAHDGAADPVGIELPKGHYVPTFHWREPLPAPAEIIATAAPAPSPYAIGPAAAEPRRWTSIALVPGVALLLALGLTAAWLRKDSSATPTQAASASRATRTSSQSQPSLAVLPFVDLSQARDQEYLADGLAEEILNQLAQVPAMRVIGRTSSFSFKGRNQDLREIGWKLDVAHLLEGSVRRDGNQLRITAQLVRANDGSHLWSKTYARELRDLFTVQEEIARDVASALSVKLDAAAFNREQGGTTSIEAHERLVRWRNTLMSERFDIEGDRERVRLAREMIALDPRCVLCLDMLARSLDAMSLRLGDAPARQLRDEALEVRMRIPEIAPDSWVAKRDHANALWGLGKRVEAIALAKEVVDSGPITKERVWDYAFMTFAVGQLDDNVAITERMRAIEPMALHFSSDLQYCYVAARRFEDAEAEYQRGRKLEGSQQVPDHVAFLRQLAGKRHGGLKELRDLHRRLEQYKEYDTPGFHALGKVLDDRAAMLAVTRRALADEAYGGADLVFEWGGVADALGDADLAVAALRKRLEAQAGFAEGSMSQFPYALFWTLPYSGVRAHPEFRKLLVETGVVDYWQQSGKWGDGCGPMGADGFQCT